MQNKYISYSLILATLFLGTNGVAQELDSLDVGVETAAVEEKVEPAPEALKEADASLTELSGLSQKKAVDFPARSSLDTLELAPLPGIYETNVTGPQPMAESVSINDMPSEQLLGRLTPEVFQEMAELERDNAYLKLQIQKEEMKNNLENVRAQYRQSRLDEIAKREEVVRSRIQWWQEQEKLRQEVEKERQEAEAVKNKMAEAEALKAQLEADGQDKGEGMGEEGEDSEASTVAAAGLYTLVDVKGTRGNLTARLKNTATEEISSVKVGDTLNGEVVTLITADSVVIDKNGTEYTVKFASQ